MSSKVTEICRENFDRIYATLEKAVAICPEELWAAKVGGFYYWQQIVHVFGLVELVAADKLDAPLSQSQYSVDVIRLLQDVEPAPSKADVLDFAAKMTGIAHDYFARMTTEAELFALNPYRTKRMGVNVAHLDAIVMLIGHGQYHVGICAAYLRDRGIKEIY